MNFESCWRMNARQSKDFTANFEIHQTVTNESKSLFSQGDILVIKFCTYKNLEDAKAGGPHTSVQ